MNQTPKFQNSSPKEEGRPVCYLQRAGIESLVRKLVFVSQASPIMLAATARESALVLGSAPMVVIVPTMLALLVHRPRVDASVVGVTDRINRCPTNKSRATCDWGLAGVPVGHAVYDSIWQPSSAFGV